MARKLEPFKHVADLLTPDIDFNEHLRKAESRGYARGYATCERRHSEGTDAKRIHGLNELLIRFMRREIQIHNNARTGYFTFDLGAIRYEGSTFWSALDRAIEGEITNRREN